MNLRVIDLGISIFVEKEMIFILDCNDFCMKQIIIYEPARGDKISYKNDNIVIKNKDGVIKYQHTCYRIFSLLIIGDCTITTGLLRRAKKFGFSICFMTYNFRFITVINYGLEGNTMLKDKQYHYNGTDVGRLIILNKILNQKRALCHIRKKNEYIKEGISSLNQLIKNISVNYDIQRDSLLAVEGNAAKIYFARMFIDFDWRGRKPRIKFDYVNSLMDIGYTLLFNFIDCILHVYDFDVYCGVFHTNFYMRKSLVCDLMEPFRPLIDLRIRKGINLGQFKKDDFFMKQNQWHLDYKKSSEYSYIFMQDLLDNKENIFKYIRGYYRAFMKGTNKFPEFDITKNEVLIPTEERG